jgi:hypothetical protein
MVLLLILVVFDLVASTFADLQNSSTEQKK